MNSCPRPPRLLLLSALIALGAVLALAAGCCEKPAPLYPAPAGLQIGRTVAEQEQAAVEIDVVCIGPKTALWSASGVQVSETSVVTAAHVVKCVGELAAIVNVAGKHVPALTQAVDYEADTALLFLLTPVPTTRAAVGHRPIPGHRICVAIAYPKPDRRCGTVTDLEALPGDVRHDVKTEPGNSGSGVYDAGGRLVGIVTHRSRTVGGLFSSVEDRAWMVRR